MEEVRRNFQGVQEELLSSNKNLLPLASHIQTTYASCKTAPQRAEAFRTAKSYVTQALASVAYQVNEAASLLEQLLGAQEQQIKALTVQVAYPRQVVRMVLANLFSKSTCTWSIWDDRKSPRSQ
jgi:hypothetical protein